MKFLSLLLVSAYVVFTTAQDDDNPRPRCFSRKACNKDTECCLFNLKGFPTCAKLRSEGEKCDRFQIISAPIHFLRCPCGEGFECKLKKEEKITILREYRCQSIGTTVEPQTNEPEKPETEAPEQPETEAPEEPETEAPEEPETEEPEEPETDAPEPDEK